ncbi:6 dehydratase [uncultured virus]|nr:6 dehydratase [uncultured virus]
MSILLTGGCGFIGSHCAVDLMNDGHEIVIVDNLSNSYLDAIHSITKLTSKSPIFYQLDITDQTKLNSVFVNHPIKTVIHFAGLKSVEESVGCPLTYYFNNIGGLLVLLEVMKKHHVKNIIFSSSATVYGCPTILPLTEEMEATFATSPYGSSKCMCEKILMDMSLTGHLKCILLRYFNPVGSREGLKETSRRPIFNLFPYLASVYHGITDELVIHGQNYDTRDGTAIRDYISVVDLANGHLKALKYFNQDFKYEVFNLGTGRGYTVLEIVRAFEKVFGYPVKKVIGPDRPGDVPSLYTDPSKAERLLGWRANTDLETIVRTYL